MSKPIKALLVVAVVFLGYIVASPYIALYNIKNAVEAKDAQAISEYIDYPSVREDIKGQFNAMMIKEMGQQSTNNDFEAVGAFFAAALVEKMVDGMVTPQGLQMAFEGKKINPMTDAIETDTTANLWTNLEESTDIQAGYQSLNQFEITLTNKQNQKNVKFIMQRDGLSWQIKKVELPLEL